VSTVEEIKQAIGQLSAQEQDRLIEWLYAQELKSAHAVMEGIATGEADYAAGRTVTQDEAKKRMAKWLK
jgi:predicted transcriptional regulator